MKLPVRVWYPAATLAERLAALRSAPCHERKVDPVLAGERLRSWRSQPPFERDAFFNQRLALAGINEQEFYALLGEPVPEPFAERAPSWLTDLDRAFGQTAAAMPQTCEAASGFLALIEPLIHQGRERLRQGIRALIQEKIGLPFAPDTVEEILFAHLPGQLLSMMERTLVLELHVARMEGALSGETSEERFASFVQRLRRREVADAILEEYPVLARQLAQRIDQWATVSLEFIQRLYMDWQAIGTTFQPGADSGVLVQVDAEKGDRHRGGRAVLIARFSTGWQLVYKPKSLAVDSHFQELLTWVNDHGAQPPLRTLKVLDRGPYGWVEFIPNDACTSTEEIRRFYERLGASLALLHVLAATDFHFENVIAAGEHPVLVDLETLFHRRYPVLIKDLGNQGLANSVLAVGLLPQRFSSENGGQASDYSGLGAASGQPMPDATPFWEGTGTDEMRLTRGRGRLPGSQNRPTLAGREIDPLDYRDAVLTGFTALYRLLWEHRQALLAGDGPLARFAEDEVRFIARPTRTYSILMYQSFHPDRLRDALERDLLFDRLWAQVERVPALARLIANECADLQEGDIPLFTTRPNSRALWTSSGECIANYFDYSGLEMVQQRIRGLSDEDLGRQVWLIRTSLAMMGGATPAPLRPAPRLVQPPTAPRREQLLAAAAAVGDRLGVLALRGSRQVTWIGKNTSVPDCQWALQSLGMDLYDGLPGVTLFLAHLGVHTGERRFTALAEGALRRLRYQVERGQSLMTGIGAFSGWGGLIYTYAHLAALWQQPSLVAEGEAAVERLLPLIERDQHLDIIGGAAGCIGGLLSLHGSADSEPALAAAIRCGDRLLAQAQAQEQGLAWASSFPTFKPLTGFAHGAAGMAWALEELATRTGAARFRAAAQAAIAYERSLFSAEAKNWPDLRDRAALGLGTGPETARFPTAWCHGAPGIGLARLQALRRHNDAALHAEVAAALHTTLARGFGAGGTVDNHSLCHGEMGNLELLLQASQTLAEPRWQGEVDRLAAGILGSIEGGCWLCATPSGVESPGLMTGLAGIGYGLLRLAEPDRVPSVLTLDPPVLKTK